MAEFREVWENTAEDIAQWCKGRVVEEIDALDSSKRFPAVNVPCKDGVKRARIGQAVILCDDGYFEVL